jgi:hypothetical protein
MEETIARGGGHRPVRCAKRESELVRAIEHPDLGLTTYR